MNKMLETFKKHLGDLGDLEKLSIPTKRPSKMEAHRFGEGLRATNELIGCLQVLSARLNKLQLIVSKIEFSLETDPDNPANINMSEILLSQARDLIANTKFIDRELFDRELSASLGNRSVIFEIESPLPFLDRKEFKALNDYIASKKEEIKGCMEEVRLLSEQGLDAETPNVGSEAEALNLSGKTIAEALRLSKLS